MTLDVLIRKMVELEEAVEEGKRAERLLDECRNIAENVMDPGTSYRTVFGTSYKHDKIHRLSRDCDLIWEVGKRADRPVVDSATMEISPEFVAGSEVFREKAEAR